MTINTQGDHVEIVISNSQMLIGDKEQRGQQRGHPHLLIAGQRITAGAWRPPHHKSSGSRQISGDFRLSCQVGPGQLCLMLSEWKRAADCSSSAPTAAASRSSVGLTRFVHITHVSVWHVSHQPVIGNVGVPFCLSFCL